MSANAHWKLRLYDEFICFARIVAENEEVDASIATVRALAAPAIKAVPKISASKTMTDNGDGTQKLSLSVTGSAESSTHTNVSKANVVVVIDVSGSMGNGITAQRIPYTYDAATYDSGNTYQANIDGTWRNLSRNSSGQWTYTRGGQTYTYSGTDVYWNVNNRIDATKAASYQLIDALLSNNKDQTTPDGISLRDVIEISLMKFSGNTQSSGSTSINDAAVLVSKSTSASALKTQIRNLSASGGTNWEAALRKAKTEAQVYDGQTGETTSVIFLTDGVPTFYLNNADSRSRGNGGTGGETRDNVHASWNYAADDAKALKDAGYDLYSIFAYGQSGARFDDDGGRTAADYLRSLTNFAYDGQGDPTGQYANTSTKYDNKYFFDASDTEALIEAFERIADTISSNVGFAGVQVEDGVTTSVTNTSVIVDGNVHEGSFTYTVTDKNDNTEYTVKIEGSKATFTIGGNTYTDDSAETRITKIDPDDESTWITSQVYSVEVNGKKYEMSPASINKDTGLIDWDLAGLGILQNGYTYTLDFDVWPNQESYDLMADLNNGVKTLDQAEASVDPAKWAELEDSIVVTFNGTSKLISELTETERAAIADGTHKCSYAVYTNYKQEVTYYQADEETDEHGTTTVYSEKQKIDLDRPQALALTSSTMDLRKIWEDGLDTTQLQRLLYDKNGNPTKYKVDLKVWKADTRSALDSLIAADGDNYYKMVTLGWRDSENDYIWSDMLDVAPGIMLTEEQLTEKGLDKDHYDKVTYDGTTYYILESGHYYTVSEVDSDYHFDLVTIVYHPMLVNGKLQNVTFKEDGTVEKIDPMSTVDATNTLRGGINLKKVVLDPDGEEYPTDDKFSFTIVLENDKPIFVGEDIPWYGVNGKYYHDADGTYIDESATGDQDGDGLADDGNMPAVSSDHKKATYELTIDSRDEVRINNVPIGTTFTITEAEADGYTLDDITHVIKIDDDEEAGKGEIDKTNRKIVAEIEPNRENNITYYNKMKDWPAFYVYHSSDNTIEKIFAEDDRVTRSVDEETGLMKMQFNIVKETKEKNLYGGYYSAYSDAKATDEQINETAETGKLTYTEDPAKETKTTYDGTHIGGFWSTDTGATPYTGITAGVWRGSEAYTPSGLTMEPEVNGVYYLKEVPDKYLRMTHFEVYNWWKVHKNCNLYGLYMLTAIDDNNYWRVGFDNYEEDGNPLVSAYKTSTESIPDDWSAWNDGSTETLAGIYNKVNVQYKGASDPESVEKRSEINLADIAGMTGTESPTNGYIAMAEHSLDSERFSSSTGQVDAMRAYFVTPDKIKVRGIRIKQFTIKDVYGYDESGNQKDGADGQIQATTAAESSKEADKPLTEEIHTKLFGMTSIAASDE